jgi:hypothetical protein
MAELESIAAGGKRRAPQRVTLAQYVERRNGVALGAPGSLKNMLARSFGAGTFARFWQYWNPIWGYALGRYVFAPLRKILPPALALILTFTLSGAVHDLAATLVRRAPAFLFTPWFTLMGLAVVAGRAFRLDYGHRPRATRVAINLGIILGCLALTLLAKQQISGL